MNNQNIMLINNARKHIGRIVGGRLEDTYKSMCEFVERYHTVVPNPDNEVPPLPYTEIIDFMDSCIREIRRCVSINGFCNDYDKQCAFRALDCLYEVRDDLRD